MQTNRIGEYIHLRYENYLNYGLLRGDSGDSTKEKTVEFNKDTKGDLSQALQKKKDRLKAMCNYNAQSGKIQEIEDKMNYFFSRKKVSEHILEDQDLKDIENIIREYIKNVFGIDFEEALNIEENKINEQTIKNASNLAYDAVENKVLLSTLRTNKLSQTTTKAAVDRRIRAIKSGIEQLEKSEVDVAKLKDRIQAIEKKIEELSENTKIIKFTGENESLPEDLRKLVKDIYKSASIAALSGTFGEAITAAILCQAFNTEKKALQDILGDFLNKNVTGSVKYENTFTEKNFANGVDIDSILQKYTKTESNGIYRWSTNKIAEGKSDVTFSIENNKFNFNVKNYALKELNKEDPEHALNFLKFVSGTSLINLFQKEGKTLNHYLNQTVESRDKDKKDVGPESSVRTSANQIMQQLIIFKSLSENPVGHKANFFIVIDKADGNKVRILTIEDLFSRLIGELKKGEEIMSIKGFDLNQKWQNNYQATAGERLTSLLQQVHKNKISVSVRRAAMKKLIN